MKSKNSSKRQKFLQFQFSYVVVAIFIIFTLATVTTLHSSQQSVAVMGASTQSHQQGFSFSSFFSSLFSFFSGNNQSSNTNANNGFSGNNSNQQNSQSTPTANTTQVTLTQAQLEAMAGNPYADGNLPLGDNKYVTSAPKIGYIYLCHIMTGNNGGGAGTDGPWIHGTTWNIKEKTSVAGKISWPNATFSNTISGTSRTLAGNDLPSHTTGVFPIQSTDPAYSYDRNPNSISAQSFSDAFPITPTYSDTPSCMGGEAGIMLTGVALFNGFDAEYRDAAAHEVQDSCQGHPEKDGEYHYHSLSSCITDINETTVIGYALDGFPITGPKVADNKYLTTANLDECHGITSTIIVDGKSTVTYHYVMTQDFPYSVSCFRGKPVSMQVVQQGAGSHMQNNMQQGNNGGQRGQGNSQGLPMQGQSNQSGMRQPPQAAITACSSSSQGSSCSFSGMNGNTVSGTCQTPPNQSSLVCVPSNQPF